MATLTGEYTLQDIKAMVDPKGNTAKAIDVLSEVNGLLPTATWMEANDLTSHVITQSLTDSSGSTSVINQGVPYSTVKSKQVRFQIEGIEDYSRVDTRLLETHPQPEQFRSANDARILKGLGREWHRRFFYGDSSGDLGAVDGLATRYNDLALDNVVSSGGTGGGSVYSSIWVIQWGMDGCYAVYPRGASSMIQMTDLGKDLVNDTIGAYQAMVSHFQVKWGIAVGDDRAVQRIANVAASSTGAFNEDTIIRGVMRLPDPGNIANTFIYVNRDVMAQMQIALKDKSNVNFYMDGNGLSGAPVLRFQGIPVIMVDKLIQTEAEVS